MRKRSLEVVLGCGNIIMGLERGLMGMSFGERAKFTIQPMYAYGDVGLPPVISPNEVLVFDVSLIKFWRRPSWTRPLIQVSGPYSETPHSRKPPPHSGLSSVAYTTGGTRRDGDSTASGTTGDTSQDIISSSVVPYGVVKSAGS